MTLTQKHLDELAARPGPDGVFGRLLKNWNPEGIIAWIEAERLVNVNAGPHMTQAMANLLASAAFVYAARMSDDPIAVLKGDSGLIKGFEHALNAKLARLKANRTQAGIIIPEKGDA